MSALSVIEVCVLQHAAAEWCVQATGRAPTWLFLVPQHGSPALVRVGDDGLPETGWVRRRAADVGAVGAVLSGEFWLGAVSIPADTAADLALADLPLAADLDPADRWEAIVSTAVQRGQPVRRRASVIERSAAGVALRRIRLEDLEPRGDGLAGWLDSILPAATNQNR